LYRAYRGPQHTTTEAASIAGAAAASVADFGHELAAVDDMLAIAEAAASKTDAHSSKAVIGRAMGLVQSPLKPGIAVFLPCDSHILRGTIAVWERGTVGGPR